MIKKIASLGLKTIRSFQQFCEKLFVNKETGSIEIVGDQNANKDSKN